MKKKYRYSALRLIFSALLLVPSMIACEKINEVPPRTQGTYSKKFQLPLPVRLTDEERAYVEALRDEYETHCK